MLAHGRWAWACSPAAPAYIVPRSHEYRTIVCDYCAPLPPPPIPPGAPCPPSATDNAGAAPGSCPPPGVLLLECIKEVEDAYMAMEVLQQYGVPLLQVSVATSVGQQGGGVRATLSLMSKAHNIYIHMGEVVSAI